METIETLKQRWTGERAKNFLDNYGCTTWREYELKYDRDYQENAATVEEIYHGYPFIHCFDIEHQIHKDFHYRKMVESWCEKHCLKKWRNQWHIVSRIDDKWKIDYISGLFHMFFVFKDSKDYTLFALRWGK